MRDILSRLGLFFEANVLLETASSLFLILRHTLDTQIMTTSVDCEWR